MSDYVLIADDDPLVVEVIVDFLGLMGINSRVAGNGREALDMIHADRPRALILDLLMPLVNGFSMLTQLAKDPGTPIPVIVLTGLSEQVDVVSHLPGVIGTMVKGRFSMAELQVLLTTAGVLEDPAAMASRRLPAPSPAVRPTGPLPAPSTQTASLPPVPPATPLRLRRTGPLPPRGTGKLNLDPNNSAPTDGAPKASPAPAKSAADQKEVTPSPAAKAEEDSTPEKTHDAVSASQAKPTGTPKLETAKSETTPAPEPVIASTASPSPEKPAIPAPATQPGE